MKNIHFATYPIAYINNSSDKINGDRLFDDKSRDSYFRSLEIAQNNLNQATKVKED